jgi:hypothetical protein
MTEVATRRANIDDINAAYKERRQLLRSELDKLSLEDPNPFADLWEFYQYWRDNELQTYQSRRLYIARLYQPLEEQLLGRAAVHTVEDLPSLRASIALPDRQVIGFIWEYFTEQHQWALTRTLYRRFTKPRVLEALVALGGSVLFEHGHAIDMRFELTLLGALVTAPGDHLEALLTRYLAYAHERYLATDEVRELGNVEIQAALRLTSGESQQLYLLLGLGSWFLTGGTSSGADGTWSVILPAMLADVPQQPSTEDLHEFIEREVIACYDPAVPYKERERERYLRAGTLADAGVVLRASGLRTKAQSRPSASPAVALSLDMLADTQLRERVGDLLAADAFYDRVVAQVGVLLEDRVRKRIGARDDLIGTALITESFRVGSGKLVVSTIDAEQEAAHQLFRGFIGTFKNPSSHRIVPTYTWGQAFSIVAFVDVLLGIVNSAQDRK